MKIKYIFIFLSIAQLSGCYEDKGNYDYREINELEVLGIDDRYDRDLDDNLVINPSLEGTLYSDTSRFTYKWTFDGNVVSEEFDLDMIVNLLPGLRKGKFVITDKATEVNSYKNFDLNVSSSTAGDLFMVLSKSRGKAELSYLRLDRENANFAVNFFEERFGQPFGTDPKQLAILYMQYGSATTALSTYIYPFGRNYGGIMALVDDQIKLLDKNSLEPDTVAVNLTGDSYLGGAVYPKPDIGGYKSQYMAGHVQMWRTIANGNVQTGFQFYEVSDGKIYGKVTTGNYIAGSYAITPQSSPYTNGYLAPFWFYDMAVNDEYTANGSYRAQNGYSLGNIMAYDIVNNRFASMVSYGGFKDIGTDDLPAFPGYTLFYGSPTNEADICYAVMRNGADFKMLVIQSTGSSHKLVKEINVSAIVNENSKFHTMAQSQYAFIVTGDKIYRYNLIDAQSGIAPPTSPVMTLSDCGYNGTARITAMCVSRSEQTMLLGVSRYGADDPEAMDNENKGDLVRLKMNPATLTLTYDKTYEGVAGIPVDVTIKYQTHIRDGKDFATNQVVDKF